MKTINKLRNRKAVSPVIATVILVAVAISVSVGVSYWMSGISAQYTQFEKIEIQTGYATKVIAVAYDAGTGGAPSDPGYVAPTPEVIGGWTITLKLKNSGSAPSTITHVFLNDLPVTTAAGMGAPGTILTDLPADGLPIMAGEDKPTQIWIASGGATGTPAEFLSSGTTVNIKLHSAGGMDYIKLIKLT